jgi:hypothetical protein
MRDLADSEVDFGATTSTFDADLLQNLVARTASDPEAVAAPSALALTLPLEPIVPGLVDTPLPVPVARPRVSLGGRIFALTLLALVVVSQPWWWNVGEVQPHAATTTTQHR